MGVVQKYTLLSPETRSLNPGNIQGICALPNGTMVAADSNDFRLKLLDASFAEVNHIVCSSWPHGVCYTDDSQVAVTVGGKEVHFVDTKSGRLELVGSVKLDHDCYDIAYHSGQMYVTSGDALYVYTKDGQLVKKLYEDTSGKLTVNRVALAGDGKKVYVTNFGKHSLVTLDETGTVLSTFRDPDLLGSTGVCVADNGSLYLCGEESRSLLQLNQDGTTKTATLATSLDGLFKPQAVAFHKGASKLVVGQENKSCLLVLSLQ